MKTVRVLSLHTQDEVRRAFQELGATPSGVDIMAPKAVHRLVKVEGVAAVAANILKQEMLSRGGDVAIPSDAYYLKDGLCDIILLGTLRQYEELCQKLKVQPFGLPRLAERLKEALARFDSPPPATAIGQLRLDFTQRVYIVGILDTQGTETTAEMVARGQEKVAEGADILEVRSPRTYDAGEKGEHMVSVVRALGQEVNAPLAVVTGQMQVARAALEAGAAMVLDPSGLADRHLAEVVAERGASLAIFYTGQQAGPQSPSVEEVLELLQERIGQAISLGVRAEKLIAALDLDGDSPILHRLSELKVLGLPLLLSIPFQEDGLAALATTIAWAVAQGANLLRIREVGFAARVARAAFQVARNDRG